MPKREIKKLPHSELELMVTLAWEEWNNFIAGAVESLSQQHKLAGFRPGKAPKDLLEKQIGLLPILEAAAEKAIQKTYARIIKEDKLEVLGAPQAEILKIAEGNDLEFRIKTAVMPEVVLKKWDDGIKKVNRKYQDKKAEVGTDEVKTEIKRVAESRAKQVTVRRPAKVGDQVQVDFQVMRDGVVIENGTGRNHPLILGRGVFIPGFEEQVVGMSEGDEKEFELTFPEQYHEKNLAGRPATFKVKLQLVQEREIPVVDDEFAKSLGKFGTLAELEKSVQEGMLHEREDKLREEKYRDYLDALVENSEIEVPEILLHQELHNMLHEFEHQLQPTGMNLKDYLARINKTEADLEKEWEPQAAKRIKSAMILERVAEDRGISPSSEEIEAEMNKTMQYFHSINKAEKDVDMEKLYTHVKGNLLNQTVLKYLEKIA